MNDDNARWSLLLLAMAFAACLGVLEHVAYSVHGRTPRAVIDVSVLPR